MVRDIKMYRTTSEMRSPRPSYGRVGGIYDPQGSTRYGRLGPLTGGLSHQNSYKNFDNINHTNIDVHLNRCTYA